ncbi:hypothetical protein [Actinoplanes sp. HUAS TT8]|uniref:hypothetical protein n=1 Tax=Actinoplanes sp. HUAS TT8 TaxID=3447453 RepID=UPI003F51AC5F
MTETDLEQRLRSALSARAAAVTTRDLRHEPAPSATGGDEAAAFRAVRRGAPARWWLPLSAGLAAAAVSITAFALLRPDDPAPVRPASPVQVTSPATPSRPASPSPPTSAPSISPPVPSFSWPTAEPTPTASGSKPNVTPASP